MSAFTINKKITVPEGTTPRDFLLKLRTIMQTYYCREGMKVGDDSMQIESGGTSILEQVHLIGTVKAQNVDKEMIVRCTGKTSIRMLFYVSFVLWIFWGIGVFATVALGVMYLVSKDKPKMIIEEALGALEFEYENILKKPPIKNKIEHDVIIDDYVV